MSPNKPLKPVVSQPGLPLYKAVQDHLINAIKRGQFTPGQRIPSTKELSKQLSVSLVTTHRALQEMVANGLLERTQGRGTFVIDRRGEPVRRLCVALLFREGASLADQYYGQVLGGVRRAAQEHDVDLLITDLNQIGFGRSRGYLLVSPASGEVERVVAASRGKAPVLLVGCSSPVEGVPSVDIDPVEMSRLAIEHLVRAGHKRIAYIGGGRDLVTARCRRLGFDQACRQYGIPTQSAQVHEASGFRLTDDDVMTVSHMLTASDRPTAVFCGGTLLSFDVYEIAQTLNLRIPGDISVIGIDDPPSASFMSPPLTTVRRPLIQLGHAALSTLTAHIRKPDEPMHNHWLKPDLCVRQSTAAPPGTIHPQ